MGKFHTPLGNLTFITEETTNTSFLQGIFNEMSFSIQVSQPFNLEKIDFNFIQNILYTQPKKLGFNHYKDKLDKTKELISFPEFIFYEKTKDWDIIFRESLLPIAEPYGILINYHDNDIVGFEDISDSEEL